MTLKDIGETLKTPAFWAASALGSVVVGIIGNILTPKVVSFCADRSSKWKLARTLARDDARREFQFKVAKICAKPNGTIEGKLESLYHEMWAIRMLLWAFLCMAIATAFSWGVNNPWPGRIVLAGAVIVLWVANDQV